MTEELKQVIKEYLRDNLKVKVEKSGGDYGSSEYINVKLILEDEVISEDSDII